MSQIFDLSDLIPDETGTLQLRHPATQKPLEGVTITAYGKDSDKFEKLQNRALKRRLKKRNAIPDPEEIAQANLETLAGCIVSWTNIYLKNEPLDFSPQNALRLLSEVKWIKEQLDEFIGDRSDFLQE